MNGALDMDTTHFLAYAGAIVASFIWIQWQRNRGRLQRAVGVVVIIALALALPWLIQQVGPIQ